MTPRNHNTTNWPSVSMGWDDSARVDPDFDTTQAELDEFGRFAFEDRVQLEARHTKEDWT